MQIQKIINSESGAWDLLNEIGTSQINADEINLVFENFPKVSLKFDGPNLDASLSVRLMDALRAIQVDVYRLYALATYNDENYNLTKEERDDLEIFFEIASGSSDVDPKNLYDVLAIIGKKAAEKVEAKHWVVICLIGAVAWSAPNVVEKVMEAKEKVSIEVAHDHEIEVQQTEETRRMEILSNALKKVPKARAIARFRGETREAIAKSVHGKERVIMPDKTEITETIAKELYPRSKRRTPVEDRMDGEYKILNLANKNGDLKVLIQDASQKEYWASYPEDMDLGVKLYEANVNGVFVSLEINAKSYEGEMKDLSVVRLKEKNGHEITSTQ